MPKGNKAKAAKLRAEASRLELDADYAYEPWREYRMRGEAMRLRRKAMKLDPPELVDPKPIVVKRPRLTKEERIRAEENHHLNQEAAYLDKPDAYLGGYHG